MSTQLPGNLAEIFPLRFRMREEMRFQAANDLVVAERRSDGQKFSLRLWQFEMLRRFDGQKTFEQAAREVYGIFPGGFTAMGLLNFYRWLYQENLVLCECKSIFELVVDEEPEEAVGANRVVSSLKSGMSMPSFEVKDWHRQALKVSATIIFCLAVLRIAYVAAPIFEPPVDRAYAAFEGYLMEDVTAAKEARSDVHLPPTPIKEMELAGRAPEPVEEAPPAMEVNVVPDLGQPKEALLSSIEDLRRRLAECRVRRDEFYLQNDEAGYRREVEIMTDLVRQIGQFESQL